MVKKQEILKYLTINRTSIAEATEHMNPNYTADFFFTIDSSIETLDKIHKENEINKNKT